VESRQDYYPLLDTTGVIVGLTPRFVGRDVPAVLYEVGPGFDAGARWVDDPRLMNLRVAALLGHSKITLVMRYVHPSEQKQDGRDAEN
jgi:hypothetical protein